MVINQNGANTPYRVSRISHRIEMNKISWYETFDIANNVAAFRLVISELNLQEPIVTERLRKGDCVPETVVSTFVKRNTKTHNYAINCTDSYCKNTPDVWKAAVQTFIAGDLQVSTKPEK